MADNLTQAHRSWLMSRVRSQDTKPEWILRTGLHRLGSRYRLSRSDLPGKPDLVFPKCGCAVFVHGCFWHRHPECPKTTTPKSNTAFWTEKFRRNVERDKKNYRELRNSGWRVVVVWQCELYRYPVEMIEKVASTLLDRGADCEKQNYSKIFDRKKLIRIAEEKVRYRLQGKRK